MDKYVTGAVIRKLRENKNMTQEELAEKVFVSSKAVSKWETGQGFPDVSLIEPLAKALGITEKAMCHKECSSENKFKAQEMLTLVKRLNLSFSEFDAIFFDHGLSKCLRRSKKSIYSFFFFTKI